CFFFQADDGIRDFHVTAVQTCALPIFDPTLDEAKITVAMTRLDAIWNQLFPAEQGNQVVPNLGYRVGPIRGNFATSRCLIWRLRSEERRVGKEAWCRVGLDA